MVWCHFQERNRIVAKTPQEQALAQIEEMAAKLTLGYELIKTRSRFHPLVIQQFSRIQQGTDRITSLVRQIHRGKKLDREALLDLCFNEQRQMKACLDAMEVFIRMKGEAFVFPASLYWKWFEGVSLFFQRFYSFVETLDC